MKTSVPTTVDMESGVVTLKRTKGFQSGTKFTIDNIVGSGVAEITLTSGQATDIIPVQVKPPSLDLTLDGNKLLFIDSESEDQEIELQQVDMVGTISNCWYFHSHLISNRFRNGIKNIKN